MYILHPCLHYQLFAVQNLPVQLQPERDAATYIGRKKTGSYLREVITFANPSFSSTITVLGFGLLDFPGFKSRLGCIYCFPVVNYKSSNSECNLYRTHGLLFEIDASKDPLEVVGGPLEGPAWGVCNSCLNES